MTKTILVCGGAGYIGAHMCEQLAERGFRVVVFDDLSGGHREAVRWGDLIIGDLRDPTKPAPCVFKDNWELSTARALTVTRFLVQAGMEPKNLIP